MILARPALEFALQLFDSACDRPQLEPIDDIAWRRTRAIEQGKARKQTRLFTVIDIEDATEIGQLTRVCLLYTSDAADDDTIV